MEVEDVSTAEDNDSSKHYGVEKNIKENKSDRSDKTVERNGIEDKVLCFLNLFTF